MFISIFRYNVGDGLANPNNIYVGMVFKNRDAFIYGDVCFESQVPLLKHTLHIQHDDT